LVVSKVPQLQKLHVNIKTTALVISTSQSDLHAFLSSCTALTHLKLHSFCCHAGDNNNILPSGFANYFSSFVALKKLTLCCHKAFNNSKRIGLVLQQLGTLKNVESLHIHLKLWKNSDQISILSSQLRLLQKMNDFKLKIETDKEGVSNVKDILRNLPTLSRFEMKLTAENVNLPADFFNELISFLEKGSNLTVFKVNLIGKSLDLTVNLCKQLGQALNKHTKLRKLGLVWDVTEKSAPCKSNESLFASLTDLKSLEKVAMTLFKKFNNDEGALLSCYEFLKVQRISKLYLNGENYKMNDSELNLLVKILRTQSSLRQFRSSINVSKPSKITLMKLESVFNRLAKKLSLAKLSLQEKCPWETEEWELSDRGKWTSVQRFSLSHRQFRRRSTYLEDVILNAAF